MESLSEFVFGLLGSARKIFQKDENNPGDAVDGDSKQKTVIYGKKMVLSKRNFLAKFTFATSTSRARENFA